MREIKHHQTLCPPLPATTPYQTAYIPRETTTQKKWTDEDYQTAFQMFDRDGDGTITRGEVETVLESLGQQANAEELDQLMKDVSGEAERVSHV